MIVTQLSQWPVPNLPGEKKGMHFIWSKQLPNLWKTDPHAFKLFG